MLPVYVGSVKDHSLLHRADETQQGRNSCPLLQFGFQLGLYHVVAPLSFLRSISLASLFAILRNKPTNSVNSLAGKWKNCTFYDKRMKLGTQVKHTLLSIFSYRAISDWSRDQYGGSF